MGEFDQQVRLSDGRALGYAEYGARSGWPVLFFHGYPGSRLDAALGAPAALDAGARLISIDRPGYGLSDFKPGRRISDWPADVLELAQALGLERFAVMGVSGGGPYAAACARFIPERLSAVAIVCGVGPFDAPDATRGMSRQNRILFAVGRYAPWLVGLAMRAMLRSVERDPDAMLKRMSSALPQVDRDVLARPEVRSALIAGMSEAGRQGVRGISQEAALYARPWGFDLAEIEIPVCLFQGEVDQNVPPGMGRHQASAIPNCRARFYPEEGHMSLAFDRQSDVLAALAAGA